MQVKRHWFPIKGSAITAGGDPANWWSKTIVGAAPPTVVPYGSSVNGIVEGALLSLTATNEAQIAELNFNDKLIIPIINLRQFGFILQMTTAIGNLGTIVAGLASARNADEDAIAEGIWFKLEGSASLTRVVVEYDDGTNTADDQDSGFDIAVSKWFAFNMNFQDQVLGRADVTMSMTRLGSGSPTGNSNVLLDSEEYRLVAQGQNPPLQVNLSAYSGGLQPIFKVEKGSSTQVGAIAVAGVYADIETYGHY